MFLEKVYKDYSSHSVFTETVRAVRLRARSYIPSADLVALAVQRFESLAASFDAESLSHLAKILYTNQPALDIVSLHTSISDLIAHALVFIEDYDCEVVGTLSWYLLAQSQVIPHTDAPCTKAIPRLP